MAIVFVPKLWRYSDSSCRSIPLFQEENILPFIYVHNQVLSACGTLIFSSLTFCSIARHGSRNPVFETVTERKCLKVKGNISISLARKSSKKNFCPYQRLHTDTHCTCIIGSLLFPWHYYIFADMPVVPTHRQVFNDRKFQAAFANKNNIFCLLIKIKF